MAIIETRKLTKNYNKNRGITDVDLNIQEGEIFGFIGPNGAGKSTTIRILLNFIYPTSGYASIFGKNCMKESSNIKKYVGYVPSEVNYYEDMKALDVISYAASFSPECSHDRISKLCSIFDVEKSKKMRQLSLGNKKKIAIVQALVSKPKLIILDEPTSGLDPLMQNRLFEVLTEENKNGATIFFSSHNLSEVQKFCSRVAIIREGKIVSVSIIDELIGTSANVVHIKTDDKIAEKLKMIGAYDLTQRNDIISFFYSKDINLLIKFLSNYNIKSIQISEPSLEDTFMGYYSKGGNNQ